MFRREEGGKDGKRRFADTTLALTQALSGRALAEAWRKTRP